jgi:hypothetical protein
MFNYKGLQFEAYRNLTERESDFEKISKRITIAALTPDNYNYNEFYEVAKKNKAYVDLFKCNGNVILPCKSNLFIYKEF